MDKNRKVKKLNGWQKATRKKNRASYKNMEFGNWKTT
jgi:hypothetical protein